jgi:prepilin-type N-terminal cleavage/methylation domain-containing protein
MASKLPASSSFSASKTKSKKGFTLAEMVIMLAVISIISSFNIGKLIQSSETKKRKSVFMNAITRVSGVIFEGVQGGTRLTQSNIIDYTMTGVQPAKVCDTNSLAQGCRTAAMPWFKENFPGVVLHTGATISFDINGANPNVLLDAYIDYNGDAGPNAFGEDVLFINYVFFSDPIWTGLAAGRAGYFYAWDGMGVNTTLFNSLYI